MSIELTDEILQDAAIYVRQAMLDSLPVDNTYCHDFSPKFEEKIERLLKQTKRRYYIGRIAQQAAAIVLAALVGISTWLAVDTEARAATLRWIREIYENSIIYHFFGDENTNADFSYEPTWLPDGYVKDKEKEYNGGRTIAYKDSNDTMYFSYFLIDDDLQRQSNFDGEFSIKTIEIYGFSGELYTPNDINESIELTWVDSENELIFTITSHLSEDDVIRIANSIYK